MSQICFDIKNIYIICIVVIGLFIFSSYIVRNPLKCPIYQTCPQCKLVQMTQKSIIKDENQIRRNINDELVPPNVHMNLQEEVCLLQVVMELK